MSNIVNDSTSQEILNVLQKNKAMSIGDIANEIYISPSSVRRKLSALQEQGLVIRTHGGARIDESGNMFPSFSFRSQQNSFQKKKIAMFATKCVKDGDFVFLDGSTSAFFLSEYLKNFKNIRVMTNGIDTISTLSKYNVEAYSTGGKISDTNRAVLVGQNAINTIEHYHADVFIFSAQSVDAHGNIYDCFEEENFLRIAMMKNADKKIFLCDSSKLGKASMFKLCHVKDVNYIISDADLSSYFEQNYKNKILTT